MAITIDPLAPNTLLAAVRDRGVFRGVRSAPKIWSWTEFNNGMPFGVTVTDLEPQSNGGIIAATYGRGAFQLFSRITTPPPPLTAVGFVILYEVARAFPDQPPGEHNPILQTIELDSKPGFTFTSTGGPLFRAVVDTARQNNRKVEITFTPVVGSPSSGNIISVKLK